jgi:hypothetical protein
VSRQVTLLATLAALLAITAPVRACPSCLEGQLARGEVWNDDFATNLVVALLPFFLIGALCFGIEALACSKRST